QEEDSPRNLEIYQKAIADYDKAIALSPQEASFWISRGDAYLQIGEEDRAKKDYEQVLRNDYSCIFVPRGQVQVELGNQEEDLKNFQEAERLFSEQGNTAAAEEVKGLIEELQQY
ncbi:MAG: tetratricopeptide repeat protein, partial [Symploca sp. SIO2E6]|nr:tetratricopeptide repeat protein [Symploca sp. SIO2E6]